MRERSCEVLVVGGGVGGCAAALGACSLGMKVILTEPTEWIGGQLTSQAVPPDEHPWIEQCGCTRRYRAFRDGVRRYYRDHLPLTAAARQDPRLNPGGGWVSFLAHEPRIAWQVLNAMLQPYISAGLLEIWTHTWPSRADVQGDRVRSVELWGKHRQDQVVHPRYVLDATELGDLLPMTGAEHVVGAESRRDTGEPHAVEGDPEPMNQQAITWVLAAGWDPACGHQIEEPCDYARWKAYAPACWAGPLLSWTVINAGTGDVGHLPLVNPDDPEYELLTYRQVLDPLIFEPGFGARQATLVNWPQNDYFVRPLLGVPDSERDLALEEARRLSLSLLYWAQTEAPRHDGGHGYPELALRPDVVGTEDGLAMAPYVRESRRIQARFTVLEQHVSEACNPGRDRAQEFEDSVGIGAYRIDLHPSTSGVGIIDFAALPFQIPLGALVPVRMRNLLAGGKNLGVTHITNGCYRLHPVEWNVGEAAGLLAAYCLEKGTEPQAVCDSPALTAEFQSLLEDQGIELSWPRLRAM